MWEKAHQCFVFNSFWMKPIMAHNFGIIIIIMMDDDDYDKWL